MTERPVDEWMRKPWPVARVARLLLPAGTPFTDRIGGDSRPSFGAGLVLIIGTSGSGKTTLMHCLVHWASLQASRPLVYLGYPESWIEVLPEFMRERASVLPSIDDLHLTPKGAILMLDDSGLFAASRRAQSRANVQLSKFAQIARHLGVTLIITAQALRVVDSAVAGLVAERATLIKWFDPAAVESDRDEWRSRILNAQHNLQSWGGPTPEGCLPFYFCDEEHRVGTFPVPDWVLTDKVSKPYGGLTPDQLKEVLRG
jgi:hypothetical protein